MEIAALAMISASTISAERGDCTQRRNPLCAPETALWSEKSENVRQTEKTILRQERYAGFCSRSFYVGDVKPEDIKAKYESGVLTVLVPKEDIKKSPVSTAITIE